MYHLYLGEWSYIGLKVCPHMVPRAKFLMFLGVRCSYILEFNNTYEYYIIYEFMIGIAYFIIILACIEVHEIYTSFGFKKWESIDMLGF